MTRQACRTTPCPGPPSRPGPSSTRTSIWTCSPAGWGPAPPPSGSWWPGTPPCPGTPSEAAWPTSCVRRTGRRGWGPGCAPPPRRSACTWRWVAGRCTVTHSTPGGLPPALGGGLRLRLPRRAVGGREGGRPPAGRHRGVRARLFKEERRAAPAADQGETSQHRRHTLSPGGAGAAPPAAAGAAHPRRGGGGTGGAAGRRPPALLAGPPPLLHRRRARGRRLAHALPGQPPRRHGRRHPPGQEGCPRLGPPGGLPHFVIAPDHGTRRPSRRSSWRPTPPTSPPGPRSATRRCPATWPTWPARSPPSRASQSRR